MSEALLKEVLNIVREAGARVMALSGQGVIYEKAADRSPVTRADLASHDVIVSGLAMVSSHPVISEESLAKEFEAGKVGTYWLVDPLDGTKEFLKGNGEFTVNVALVEGGRPVLGVVYAPAADSVYWAVAGRGAYRNGQSVFNRGGRPEPVGVDSRSHASGMTESFYEAHGIKSRRACGSSLKFCLLAEGTVDVYPRFVGSSEWDTAAGHIVANEGGCRVVDVATGQEMVYGKPGWRNNAFVAFRADLDLV